MKKHIRAIISVIILVLTIVITQEITIQNQESVLLGDVNNDKVLDSLDLLFVQRHILEVDELDKREKIIADMNFDGEITIVDLALIKRYIVR